MTTEQSSRAKAERLARQTADATTTAQQSANSPEPDTALENLKQPSPHQRKRSGSGRFEKT
ncbi:MAG: hypothetical protein ABI616_06355 [Pseudomonadota bacterium]